MLNLVEEYVLLVLSNLKQGDPNFLKSLSLNCIIQCILEELKITGFLRVARDGNVCVLKTGSSGSQTIDFILQEIASSGEQRSFEKWIHYFVTTKPDLTKAVVANMVQKGILAVEEKRRFGIFSYAPYSASDPKISSWLKLKLRCIAIACQPPDERSMALLKIIQPTKQFSKMFDRYEREIANKTIECYYNRITDN